MATMKALLVAALAVCGASSVYAHHSHPYFYDACNSVAIEGRVERVEFKDPHTVIVLRLDDGAAYVVDWAPQSRLVTDGVFGPAKDALVFGARVAVAGNRIRTAAQIRERFPDFKNDVNPNTLDPTSIRRVGEAFSWALPNLPKCER
jgi:hypothetical protein